MVAAREGGGDAEATAVEVDEEGKLVAAGGGGRFRGEEQPGGYGGLGGDRDVLGGDATDGGVGGRGRDEVGVAEPLDVAASVDSEEREKLLDYLSFFGWIHWTARVRDWLWRGDCQAVLVLRFICAVQRLKILYSSIQRCPCS